MAWNHDPIYHVSTASHLIFSKKKIKQSTFQFEEFHILNVYIYSTFTETGVSGNLTTELKVAGGSTEDVI